MYEPIEYEQATKMLKEEETQELALIGMELLLEKHNRVSMCSVGGEQAILYLRDTYLECIDSIDFVTWVTKGNEDGKPMILDKYNFKQFFKEIDEMNFTLKGMVDDIAILYGQEWWIFGTSDGGICLATTEYKDDYNKIDLVGIHKAMSSFTAVFDILEREDIDLDNWSDVIEEKREQFIEDINKTSNNLFNKYDISEMSNFELRELVCSKIGLADYV